MSQMLSAMMGGDGMLGQLMRANHGHSSGPGRIVFRFGDLQRRGTPSGWRGAGREQIEENSGRFQVPDAQQLSEENKTCAVCQCDFEDNDDVRMLPCMHMFHADCVDRWLKDNRTCPICKKDIVQMERETERLAHSR